MENSSQLKSEPIWDCHFRAQCASIDSLKFSTITAQNVILCSLVKFVDLTKQVRWIA